MDGLWNGVEHWVTYPNASFARGGKGNLLSMSCSYPCILKTKGQHSV